VAKRPLGKPGGLSLFAAAFCRESPPSSAVEAAIPRYVRDAPIPGVLGNMQRISGLDVAGLERGAISPANRLRTAAGFKRHSHSAFFRSGTLRLRSPAFRRASAQSRPACSSAVASALWLGA